MWSFPFGYRIIALVLFLGLVSAVELAARGRRAVRWRASMVIVALGVVGALAGLLIDLATSSLSPGYFAVGKDLGWDDGLRWRACRLGLEAGAGAGVVIGCVLAYFNYRAGLPSLPMSRVLREASSPLVAAVLFSVLLGAYAAFFPPRTLLDTVRSALPEGHEHRFVLVWFTHTGLYLGAVVGVVVAAVRIRRARRAVLPRAGSSADAHETLQASPRLGRASDPRGKH